MRSTTENMRPIDAPTNGIHAMKNLDVLIIGAGFGGCYSLYKLRKLGLKVHLFEAGAYLGGVWHWNTYPGARVDSEIPYYQFAIPEVWRKWSWSERFPGQEELNAYFKHVDDTLCLSKDISYFANVVHVQYNDTTSRWVVRTEDGREAECTYLLCATGSSFKPYYPDFKNLDLFQGQLIHSTRWPKKTSTRGKRVAIVGSGATAVQITQEVSKEAEHLTVYIRTASISLPMVQRELTEIEQRINKSMYRSLLSHCRQTKSGLGYDLREGSAFDLSENEREELWEELWSRGGFNFNQANYRDFLVDPEANKLMYEFWAKKTRPRLKNTRKAAFLVPEKAPFAFGTKRSSLEQDYYECLDQDNVDIVDLKGNPIQEFTEKGIVCRDGEKREFDVIVLATGFDAMTGSLTNMNIYGRDGLNMGERWKDGVFTHLGLCTSGCPNMFMIYGPQAPTAFTNGPVFIEVQVDVVVDFIRKMRRENIKSIEAQRSAEEQWKQAIQEANDKTLLPLTDSWWYSLIPSLSYMIPANCYFNMGANIPGKKREQLNYLGGIANYEKECRNALQDMNGFDVLYY